MKRALCIILAVLAIAGLVSWRSRGPEEATTLSGDFRQRLDQRRMPELEFRDASLKDVVAEMNRHLSQQPETAALRVAIWTAPEPPPGFHRSEPNPGNTPDPPAMDADERSITLHLANVPLSSALRYVGNLSGRVVGRMGDTVYFVEGLGSFGPMIERTAKVSRTAAELLADDPVRTKEAFQGRGIPFYEGSEVRFIAHDRLAIRHLEEELDALTEYVEFDLTLRERVARRLTPLASWIRAKFSPPPAAAPASGFIPLPGSIPGLAEPVSEPFPRLDEPIPGLETAPKEAPAP